MVLFADTTHFLDGTVKEQSLSGEDVQFRRLSSQIMFVTTTVYLTIVETSDLI